MVQIGSVVIYESKPWKVVSISDTQVILEDLKDSSNKLELNLIELEDCQ